MVSAARAANLSLRSLLDSEAEAGPPPPVLEPTLFWKSISQSDDTQLYLSAMLGSLE